MIISKVYRAERRGQVHRSDYGDCRPVLGNENVVLPVIGTKEARALRLLLEGTLTHREFDALTHSMRLAIYIDNLRTAGFTIVNHDLAVKTKRLESKSTQVSYELYARIEPELKHRLNLFCVAVDQWLLREAAV